jgi:RNA polymerase-binding transcription factor
VAWGRGGRLAVARAGRRLAKLAEGRYGVSENPGAPIPYERLAAVPWARHGIDE